MCIQCSIGWLLKKPTCPLCRKACLLFCRATRSKGKAYELMSEAFMIWNHIRDMYDSRIPMSILATYIRNYFLDEEHRKLWYRPELVDFKHQFQHLCRVGLSEDAWTIATWEECEILHTFIRS